MADKKPVEDEDDLSDLVPVPPPEEDEDISDLSPVPGPAVEPTPAPAPAAPPKPADTRNFFQRFLTDPQYEQHRDMVATAMNPMLAHSVNLFGKTEEGGRGVLDALTYGAGDEMVGYLNSRFPSLNRSLSDLVNGVSAPPAMTYQQARDEERALMHEAAENSPATYYGAGAASAFATPSPLPQFKIKMDAPKLRGLLTEKTANALANGAVSGGLNAFGASEAELAGEDKDILGTAGNVVVGGAGGGMFSGGMTRLGEYLGDTNAVPRFANWLQEKLERAAERRAVKSATGQNQAFWKAQENKGKIQDIGRTLLDEGIVTAGKSQGEIRQGIEDLHRESGEAIGDTLQRLDEIARPSQKVNVPLDVVSGVSGPDGFLPDLMNGPEAQRQAGRRVATEIENLLSNVETEVRNKPAPGRSILPSWREPTRLDYQTPMDLQDLNRFKSQLDESINWDSIEPPPTQNALRQLRGVLNGAVEQSAEDISTSALGRYKLSGETDAQALADSKLFADFMAAKTKYGQMAPLLTPSLQESIRQDSNRWLSPSDYGSASTGAIGGALFSGGSPMTMAAAGAGLGLLNKLARARGPQVAAAGMDALAKSDAMSRLSNITAEQVGNFVSSLDAGALYGIGRAAGTAVDPNTGNRPAERAQTEEGQRFYRQVVSNPQAFGQFARQLTEAASRGPDQLAMQDYLLSASPEYIRVRREAAQASQNQGE